MDEDTLEIDFSTVDTWEFTDKERQELWEMIWTDEESDGGEGVDSMTGGDDCGQPPSA